MFRETKNYLLLIQTQSKLKKQQPSNMIRLVKFDCNILKANSKSNKT